MLQAAGCDRIFQEKVSGVREHRPEWDKLLEYVRPGDTIVVAELSRMTRSLMHLLKLTQELEAKGVSIASLREHIDTSTATGRAFVSIIGAINQMERELKAERAASGRAAAKARGRSGGRPSIPLDTMKNAMLIYKNSDKTAAEVCKMFSIGRRTLFGFIKQQEEAAKP
jgi:DNA invertase Pin-like site-specific DNA recombinase